MLVAVGVVAAHHQHFFNMRLDFDVDGPANSVSEINVRAEPAGPANPRGNAFRADETLLGTEKAARRDADPASARRRRVFNPAVRNAQGHWTGYMLETPHVTPHLAAPDAPLQTRAGFVTRPFWVTRFKPEERNAAGFYVNQNPAPGGLPVRTDDDEPIAGQDLVVWHTFGTTHVSRPEDWPVMPVARVGFRLVPHGFFDRNPALDVPVEVK